VGFLSPPFGIARLFCEPQPTITQPTLVFATMWNPTARNASSVIFPGVDSLPGVGGDEFIEPSA
jgi:hypothetical protein